MCADETVMQLPRVGESAVVESCCSAQRLLVAAILAAGFDSRPFTLHTAEPGSEDADIVLTHRLVETIEAAEATRFRGSPSIVVEGVDACADADDPVGLSCRVYQTPDGPAGSPTTALWAVIAVSALAGFGAGYITSYRRR